MRPGVEGQLKTQFRSLRGDSRIAFTLACVPLTIEHIKLHSFKPPAFGNIAEDGHRAERFSFRVPYGRSRVVNWPFSSVSRDKHSVIRQSEHDAFPDCAQRRILHRLARLLIDNVENLLKWPP
jgi:hypothetical protein